MEADSSFVLGRETEQLALDEIVAEPPWLTYPVQLCSMADDVFA